MDKLSKGTKPAKRRTYNTRLIKRDYCYRVEEVAELFGLHVQAVRRWLRDGLRRIDDRRPILIHGSDLIAFLDERQSKRKCRCAAGELYCCRCRMPRRPRSCLVRIELETDSRLLLSGECVECAAAMRQIGSVRKLDLYRSTFVVQMKASTRIDGRSEPSVMCHLDEEENDAALQPQK